MIFFLPNLFEISKMSHDLPTDDICIYIDIHILLAQRASKDCTFTSLYNLSKLNRIYGYMKYFNNIYMLMGSNTTVSAWLVCIKDMVEYVSLLSYNVVARRR